MLEYPKPKVPATQEELVEMMERDFNGGRCPIWRSPASRRRIEETPVRWRMQPCCQNCRFCWGGDNERLPANYYECWHPEVKWEKPFPHGPGIHIDHQLHGVCPRWEPQPDAKQPPGEETWMPNPTAQPFSVVATIPEPVNYEHLSLFGLCNPECPFYRNDEQSGYACTRGRSRISMHNHPPEHDEATGWEEQVMRPGPECPRGEKKENQT